MVRRYFFPLQIVGLIATVPPAFPNVAVKAPFASHMVLQRNMINPVWGTASAGEQVAVTLGSQTQTVTTPSNGKWTVKLDSMAAAGPLTMTIKGNNTVTLTDVHVGEVWQVAGQSNMDTRMEFYPNLADSIRAADVPLLRYYTLRQDGGRAVTTWLVVNPTTARQLSATGYFFGKEILKTTGVAVGLVVTAVGGTKLETWMDPATLSANPSITTSGKGGMWNEWVAPVVGYGIKGTAWIQGEQNANGTDAPLYDERFKLLIKGWRAAWGQGDFPFYFGQLSSTSGTPAPGNVSNVAVVREGQRMALALPHTAMTVNMDIGIGDWHYPNKPDAGMRLSLPAKAQLYGKRELVYSGPMYRSMTVQGGKVKLIFDHVGGGLVAKGSLSGFAIAAASGSWVWGDASISGDTVIVSSASIANPTRVRYAWSDKPAATLFNKEGLPASPFTTESPLLPTQVIFARHSRAGAMPLRFISWNPSLEASLRMDLLGRRMGEKSARLLMIDGRLWKSDADPTQQTRGESR